MKTRLLNTFLSLILIGLPSLGWGRENLSNPTVLSGPGINTNTQQCQIINVYSYAIAGEKIYAQVGVGWVISAANQLRILLPAHVVAGAELLTGKCGNNVFPLALKSKSETLDLALLDTTSQATPYLLPLISLEDRNDFLKSLSGKQKSLVSSLAPPHTKSDITKALSEQSTNFYLIPSSTPNNPEMIKAETMISLGYSRIEKGIPSLYAESQAIRPGFSGSPFFVQSRHQASRDDMNMALFNPYLFDKAYLVGMLTKAEINGSRSLGISLPDILETLPRLLASSDADAGRPIRLRYAEKINGGILERKQELIQNLSDGSQRIFTEICNDSTAESSEWNTSNQQPSTQTKSVLKELSVDPQKIKTLNPEDFKKITSDLQRSHLGTSARVSGGDYGEGGGSLYTLKDAIFMKPTRDSGGFLTADLSAYKSKKFCDQPMIKDQHGKKFDSITVGGKQIKTTTLAEYYTALTTPGLGQNSCISTYLGGFGMEAANVYLVNGEELVYTRVESSIGNSASENILQCNGSETRVKLSGGNLFVDATFSKSGSARGSVQLRTSQGGLCDIQLNGKNTRSVGSWRQQIRTKDVDIDVTFGAEDRAMGFKILRASAACNPFHSGKLWMYELNFSNKFEKLRSVMSQ
ncbi:hypothetical protein ACLVWU_10530 [Bdellovibrio sp. HCB290]|uniref:hypothetical protein n=1 Tax=Bdellovibrio sp. HCB290 TaxID=3394356 RepID=UPI0039B6C016